MKKLFLLSILAFSTFSFTPNSEAQIHKITPEKTEVVGCNYGQCQATAKSTGNQCKHCVSNQGDLYCWQHK